MKLTLFACAGGTLVLPAGASLLLSREDGGNLIVHPPRPVWERSLLDVDELDAWGRLIAASGAAMIATLPQLEGGCVNYWEAGNWALNGAAEPLGPKTASAHRNVHQHLIGRSRFSANPRSGWGESPHFPLFSERHEWARAHQRLTPAECTAIVKHAEHALRESYGFGADAIRPWSECPHCAYPSIAKAGTNCEECSGERR